MKTLFLDSSKVIYSGNTMLKSKETIMIGYLKVWYTDCWSDHWKVNTNTSINLKLILKSYCTCQHLLTDLLINYCLVQNWFEVLFNTKDNAVYSQKTYCSSYTSCVLIWNGLTFGNIWNMIILYIFPQRPDWSWLLRVHKNCSFTKPSHKKIIVLLDLFCHVFSAKHVLNLLPWLLRIVLLQIALCDLTVVFTAF